MGQLGVREVVGLAALLFAVVVAAMFLNPANSESTGTPGGIVHGTVVGTPTLGPETTPTSSPTPPPTPTATPLPPQPLPPIEGGWLVKFFERLSDGSELATTRIALRSIDFSYANAPFGDFKDNAWGLAAETTLSLPSAGRYTFAVEHDGALRVLIDGAEVAAEDDGPSPRTLQVTFEHTAGSATVTVECRDLAGPFLVRVK